ncbi:M23 family metallopeptidase [Sandarakinorhabdus sp. AAP62]|uniref:M23 family metallopeptidase n=1 Tax=Sandarakinorhabdus sp. AAP62 TaxID=1248916 RepID=UPI00036CA8A2|nr:M23 family metallopeptidase [Sandarakinorhabdus sp. AAP62]
MRRAAESLAALVLLLALPGCMIGRPEPAPRPTPRVVAPPTRSATTPPPQRQTPPPARTDWVVRRVVPAAIVTPEGRFHVVKTGETGIAIARAYGLAWRDLVALNKLQEPFVLRAGQRLRLTPVVTPSPRPAPPPPSQTLEQRARAFDITIDDVMTGGQPAANGPVPRRAGEERPAPLPAVTGNAPAFRWPLPGRIISGFGPKPGGRFNDGVNLKASPGEAVRAAGDGVVAYAGDAIPGFGNLLLVKHAGGWVSAYAHNEALLVARGARVKAGEVVARAGQSGAVAEPQLHFELRRGRAPVDPAKVIGGR